LFLSSCRHEGQAVHANVGVSFSRLNKESGYYLEKLNLLKKKKEKKKVLTAKSHHYTQFLQNGNLMKAHIGYQTEH